MTDTKKQLLPTEGDIIPTNHMENLILDIRGQQVMLDRDLANLYGVDTKVLNQAVKRNIERFPVRFRFQLSDLERDKLVTNCDRLQMLKHSNVNPFVFTEQGVAMLSTVLWFVPKSMRPSSSSTRRTLSLATAWRIPNAR